MVFYIVLAWVGSIVGLVLAKLDYDIASTVVFALFGYISLVSGAVQQKAGDSDGLAGVGFLVAKLFGVCVVVKVMFFVVPVAVKAMFAVLAK